jgi:hypothetical protein
MKSTIVKIKNKVKIIKDVLTIWLVKAFVSNINLKKFTILAVMRMMKKDVKFVRYL